MQVQTRSEQNGLRFFDSFKEAYQHSKQDKTVWKISIITEGNEENVRLVKNSSDRFVLSLLSEEVLVELHNQKWE